ncbi:alpha-tocopherol transfer protein-like [Trichoplusia ni]|uniref:Alpha-tocopherol transfer protein-like n=1 Tax=Trichoplusia ni TaxID=7111 RepID=A0A7E5WWH2_TRINI|nr:alpha-tocopherol transfer protein-like [Trichoplusia ni]XP_026741184.1 alpha-tocopherol transfer protein-like [Trichoplusia ni]XP_026741185.1 alpha-tocopherol transfer protein-like [Trichoplusia ni]XP_026741186.1 alpha-tocopherol transfer protein-like [Trichoplusia ni]XP_026745188.1 alpha-tocopherol transfer protein-like [Trichoplusia ni]XP_026745189.1 alpha-tocopherol transfer protein-like [Trichoplusia ni]XP_026745190.1 alpha-tocopherol transfer protein-like [Trichoplusia ni]XP_02674519
MGEEMSPEVQKKVEQLQDWINKQPHLPKDIEDKIARRFLHSCYYDMDKTKSTVELFFRLRDTSPELINHRDPLSPPMQKVLKIVNLAQYEISGKRNIWFWQLNDPGLEQYDHLQDARMFIMLFDAWILNNTEFAEEDIVVLDTKDINLKFITKFNVSVARKIAKYQEEAMPIRLKQIHILNAPPFIDKLFGLMKPFLKAEITAMVHFHVPKSDTIFKYLSKEDLPKDYGGTRPSMAEMNKEVLRIVMEQRETFLDENFWKTEKKSKGTKNEVATFRTLDID